MTSAPLFSTFSAVAEIFVTLAVFIVIFHNFRERGFLGRLALGVIVFEFSVNMLYMVSRMDQPVHTRVAGDTSWILPAVHGSLSLFVFILFVVLTLFAWSFSQRGRFFFREHRILTYTFLFLWMASVLSGHYLYARTYLLAPS